VKGAVASDASSVPDRFLETLGQICTCIDFGCQISAWLRSALIVVHFQPACKLLCCWAGGLGDAVLSTATFETSQQAWASDCLMLMFNSLLPLAGKAGGRKARCCNS